MNKSGLSYVKLITMLKTLTLIEMICLTMLTI